MMLGIFVRNKRVIFYSHLWCISRLPRMPKKGKKNVRYVSDFISSPVADKKIPEVLLHRHLMRYIDKWAHKVAVECGETRRKLTYGEIEKLSDNMAGFFQRLGLEKGDVVSAVMMNVPEFFVVIFGCMKAGLILSTINPIYTKDGIKKKLGDSKAKVVITMNGLCPVVKSAVEELEFSKLTIISVIHLQTEVLHSNVVQLSEIINTDYPYKEVDANPDDIVLLPFSSGTSGASKAVMLSHKNLVANSVQADAPEFQLVNETYATHQDVIPLILPMFHIYGLSMVALNLFAHGVKFVTLPRLTLKGFAEVLHEDNPAIIYLVPPIVLMLLTRPELDLPNLKARVVMSGAAPLGAKDVARFEDTTRGNVRLMQTFGMTEASPVALQQSMVLQDGIIRGGSGFVLPNTECKIVDLNSENFNNVGPNIKGELWIRGPQIMKGYFDNEEANKKWLVDGWLRTGDAAYYNEYEHFFVLDRIQDIVMVEGHNVYPSEIEEVLRTHPDIVDAAVIGVPDGIRGEFPRAFVVLSKSANYSVKYILQYVDGLVPEHNQLKGGVSIVDAIPKTASGKVSRKNLRLKYLDDKKH